MSFSRLAPVVTVLKVLRVTATLRSTFAREDSRLFAISCNAMRYCFAIVMVFSLSFRFWSR